MKNIKVVLLFAFGLGIGSYSYGQDEYIILKKDSTKVVGDVSKSGNTIKLNIQDEQIKYNISEILEYSKSEEIYQVFAKDGFYEIFTLKERGAVNLYIETSGAGINTVYKYYVKKQDQNYPQKVGAAQTTLHNQNFREEYSEYFKDCEEVKEMILNKVVKPIEIQYIVQTYNKCVR